MALIPNAPNDSLFGSTIQSNSLTASPTLDPMAPMQAPDPFEESKLLALFDKVKREAMENRWVWEREWLRDNYYIANRQWITYHPTRREWVDKRLHKWIPRPVTNKMAEVLQAIRTNLIAIELSVKCRPIGNDTQSVAASEIADLMAPAIHEEHDMNQVMRESDYWLIVNGTSCLQVSWDLDKKSNQLFVPHEQCLACMNTFSPVAIQETGNTCPACGAQEFQPAADENGNPIGEWQAFGRGKTHALSPFEYAFPAHVTRFDELPYIIRLRWRDKHWFEANLPDIVPKISWEKSSSDRSLQLFKSLALSNDASQATGLNIFGSPGSNLGEGVTEYELWLKPTTDYPEGLVMRVIGDKDPILLQVEEEGLPGPFPYKDIKGRPIFPFVFAQYEHIGGRLYGRSALSPLIQKQDQLNQLDSLVQLIIQRMANPIWIIPEGAGIDQITGEPGLMLKWNPIAAGGQAKPERISGAEVPQSLQVLRQQIIQDIEELSGAFDIIKGQKPTGIEAFSALQLLVERSQSRFTAVFQARGEMYRDWFKIAIELERQFGPEQRVWSVIGPNRGYTFQNFQNAELQGQIAVQIEDGSNMPKTALGKRAAVEQAAKLMLINPNDPDQKFALMSMFGLTDLVPTLNYHVQAALQVQDSFEKWAENPIGPPPLAYKPWFDALIHLTEHTKWLNTDKMRELLTQMPQLEQLIVQYLQILQIASMPPMPVGPDGLPIDNASPGGGSSPAIGGGAMALSNSNNISGSSTSSQPKGNKEHGPNVGPT